MKWLVSACNENRLEPLSEKMQIIPFDRDSIYTWTGGVSRNEWTYLSF